MGMIVRGDHVRVSEIGHPRTKIAEELAGKVGTVKTNYNGNTILVDFREGSFTRQVLLFDREVVKINYDFVIKKIKDILSDNRRFVTIKLRDIAAVDGGCMKHILENTNLTLAQKLVAVAAEVYNPATIKQLNEVFVSKKGESFVVRAIERLEKMKLVHTKGNKVYPVITLLPPPKNEGEKEEKTGITEFDKDVMLFTQKLQEFYIDKTIEASISKKGKKHIKSTVQWLNKALKDKFGDNFPKRTAYKSYIDYTLGHLAGDHLKHLKRLTYAANKNGWVHRMTGLYHHNLDAFKPILLDKRKTDKAQFFGIKRGAIPAEKDIKSSGYYTTAVIFFLARLQYERYPICTEVLYALEMLTVYYFYNRMNVKDLIEKHALYAKQYKKAKELNKLDNLLEYSKTGRVKSFFCADCDRFGYCPSQGREVKTCKEKVQISTIHS